MRVGGAEGLYITPPRIAAAGEVGTAPGERRAAEPDGEDIRDRPRRPSVAVRERVDRDDPVMQAHGDLVGWIGLILHPVLGIVERLAQLHLYVQGIHTKISLGRAESAGPCPHVAEHACVQIPQERIRQNVAALPPTRPRLARRDVRLFGFVQFVTIGDPGLPQSFPFVGIERRRAVRVLAEQVAHGRSQRSRRRM